MDAVLQHPASLWTEHVCFSPNCHLLATCCGEIALLWEYGHWETPTAELKQDGSAGNIWKCAFFPDSSKLCLGYSSGQLEIWSMSPISLLHKLQPHKDCLFGVTVHPNGIILATCSADKTVQVINTQDGAIMSKLNGHYNSVEDVAFSPDGNLLASCSKDHTILLWSNFTSNKPCHVNLIGHTKWVYSCSFSPSGLYLVSGSVDKKIGIWSVKHKQLLQFMYGHTNVIWKALFMSVQEQGFEERLVFTCSSDTTARIWDVKTGKILHIYHLTGEDGSTQLLSCDYNRHHKVLALGCFNGKTYLKSVDMEGVAFQLRATNLQVPE